MKTLVAGENIVLTATENEITIDSAGEISGTITNALTASYVETAQTASYVDAANIDGTVLSASFAHTASYVETAQTASYVDAANIDGTVLSSSFSVSSSFSFFAQLAANATTASFAHTASYAETASFYEETDTLDSVVARGNSTTSSISVGNFSSADAEITGTCLLYTSPSPRD